MVDANVKKIIIEVHFVTVQNKMTLCCTDKHTFQTQSDGAMMLSIYPSQSEITVIIDGKTQEDTVVVDGKIVADATVRFNQIWVDDILIENWAFAPFCDFCPAPQGQDTGFQIGPDLMFYANGTCRIDLDDFFHRYHRNLIDSLLKLNDWVVNSHLGYIHQTDRIAMQEIYEKICALKK